MIQGENTPGLQKRLRKFYENLAVYDDECFYYLYPPGQERRTKVLALLSAGSGDVIADLGCGDGSISGKIITKVKAVYGVDLSLTRIRRARKKGLQTACGSVTELPFRGQMFSRLICSEVIEHLPQPKDLLKEVVRILKPEGVAVFTVPLEEYLPRTLADVPAEDLENMDYLELKRKYKLVDDHLHSFTERSFQMLLQEVGLVSVELDYTRKYNLQGEKYYYFLLSLVEKLKKYFGLERGAYILIQLLNGLFYRQLTEKAQLVAKVKRG